MHAVFSRHHARPVSAAAPHETAAARAGTDRLVRASAAQVRCRHTKTRVCRATGPAVRGCNHYNHRPNSAGHGSAARKAAGPAVCMRCSRSGAGCCAAAHQRAQPGDVEVTDVAAVEQHGARVHVVEALHEAHRGDGAARALADQHRDVLRRRDHGEAAQHRADGASRERERDVPKLHLALRLPRRPEATRPARVDLRRPVDHCTPRVLHACRSPCALTGATSQGRGARAHL